MENHNDNLETFLNKNLIRFIKWMFILVFINTSIVGGLYWLFCILDLS